MMQALLADSRRRGDALACLWASEGSIYGRYGYGLAALTGELTLARERSAFAEPFSPRGDVRLIDADEAAVAFPPLYEQLRAGRPGLISRDEAWWRTRRLADDPTRRQGGPLTYALLTLDGAPAGYALYRVTQDWHAGASKGTVRIVEAVASAPEAARELWRWLLDFDWTSQFVAEMLPLDHPLFQLLAEPRRMAFTVDEGICARLVDARAALAARAYSGDAEVVLEVSDETAPWNTGRFRVGPGGVERTDADADIRLGVAALGSVYLGGFGFADLARGLRLEELRAGAVDRADALFRTTAEPWCAEIF
jgi:predicted acetyltransferase